MGIKLGYRRLGGFAFAVKLEIWCYAECLMSFTT